MSEISADEPTSPRRERVYAPAKVVIGFLEAALGNASFSGGRKEPHTEWVKLRNGRAAASILMERALASIGGDEDTPEAPPVMQL